MSKILHAKQSRCLKPKYLLVLIYKEKNLRKDLLNYLLLSMYKHFLSVYFTGITREDKVLLSSVFQQQN